MILNKRAALIHTHPDDLQWRFVEAIHNHALFGMHFFYAYKVSNSPDIMEQLPLELVVAYNADGMHIFNIERTLLQSFGYEDIYRYILVLLTHAECLVARCIADGVDRPASFH
jgi:hypothetical protein